MMINDKNSERDSISFKIRNILNHFIINFFTDEWLESYHELREYARIVLDKRSEVLRNPVIFETPFFNFAPIMYLWEFKMHHDLKLKIGIFGNGYIAVLSNVDLYKPYIYDDDGCFYCSTMVDLGLDSIFMVDHKKIINAGDISGLIKDFKDARLIDIVIENYDWHNRNLASILSKFFSNSLKELIPRVIERNIKRITSLNDIIDLIHENLEKFINSFWRSKNLLEELAKKYGFEFNKLTNSYEKKHGNNIVVVKKDGSILINDKRICIEIGNRHFNIFKKKQDLPIYDIIICKILAVATDLRYKISTLKPYLKILEVIFDGKKDSD
ncbi:MAG: hypothetical protein ACTSRP_25980 [Candidatus Helarchaeota archaeon]